MIELDGGGHYTEDARAADRQRSMELECEGLMVVRFSNLEVDRMFFAVCKRIDQVTCERIGLGNAAL